MGKLQKSRPLKILKPRNNESSTAHIKFMKTHYKLFNKELMIKTMKTNKKIILIKFTTYTCH